MHEICLQGGLLAQEVFSPGGLLLRMFAPQKAHSPQGSLPRRVIYPGGSLPRRYARQEARSPGGLLYTQEVCSPGDSLTKRCALRKARSSEGSLIRRLTHQEISSPRGSLTISPALQFQPLLALAAASAPALATATASAPALAAVTATATDTALQPLQPLQPGLLSLAPTARYPRSALRG